MEFNFKTLTNRFRKTPSADLIMQVKTPVHPNRDWKLMFIVFSLVNLVIAASSLYFFFMVEGGAMYDLTEDATTESVTIDRSKLETVIRTYGERESQLEILKQRPVITTDPSL